MSARWQVSDPAGVVALVLLACAPGAAPQAAGTSITIDGSWGRTPVTLTPSASATTVAGNRGASYSIPGNVYTIGEAQGKLAGNNLFHSFGSFSVGQGDAAVFTTTTASLRNVISRVTGASPTTIEGLLALQSPPGSSPAFFFINPAGVTFGQGAQVDVPGALHVSTANQLRFADGTVFKAGAGSDSALTVAAPEAFGFLGQTRTAVRIAGGATLAPAPGYPVSVVAGDVEVDKARVLSSDGGPIYLVAAGLQSSAVPIASDILEARGTVRIVHGGNVLASSASARAGGHVSVSAGDITIDGQSSGTAFTGIVSEAPPGSLGKSGGVTLRASGSVSVLDGGLIASQSFSDADAGTVDISATHFLIDGHSSGDGRDARGNPVQTGILVCSCVAGTASAVGGINLTIADDILIRASGRIASRSRGNGSPAPIIVAARDLNIEGDPTGFFTGMDSRAFGPAAGADIAIDVVGQFSATDTGFVLSRTTGSGNAGSIRVNAQNILFDGKANLDVSTGVGSESLGPGNTGALVISATDTLSLLGGGVVQNRLFSTGSAGGIVVRAGELRMDGRDVLTGILNQAAQGTGNAGDTDVAVVRDIRIERGAAIANQTWTAGNAGNIKISAANMTIDGVDNILATGISSGVLSGDATGRAGQIDIVVPGTLSIAATGYIASFTLGRSAAGDIRIRAGTLLIDARDSPFVTGIASDSYGSSADAGRAGHINLVVGDVFSILNSGVVGTSTWGPGAAGTIDLAARRVLIDGRNSPLGSGLFADTYPGSSGSGGAINVTAADSLVVLNSAQISTSSQGSGDGGSIVVRAGSMRVEGGLDHLTAVASSTEGPGKGGSLDLAVQHELFLGTSGALTTSTTGAGNAGEIQVSAGSLRIAAEDPRSTASIQAVSGRTASGNAGDITVQVEDALQMSQGGLITARTESPVGSAGNLLVSARTVALNGGATEISAGASAGSSGRVGNVMLRASQSINLTNGAALSIRNDATVSDPSRLTPTLLSVSAPAITLRDARVSAESTGNVAASNIQIQFLDQMLVDPSSITTSAAQGNGGSIGIHGPGVLRLDHSQVTTSVSGLSGNGGDISIQVGALVMNNGFIQANSAGPGASGGNVSITVNALVASGNQLSVGGRTPAVFQPGPSGLNVIQAAAPDGVSGNIHVTSPVQDVTGKLAALSAPEINLGALGKDLCRTGAGSSLTPLARGGMRPVAAELIRPEGALALAALGPDLGVARQRSLQQLAAAITRDCK